MTVRRFDNNIHVFLPLSFHLLTPSYSFSTKPLSPFLTHSLTLSHSISHPLTLSHILNHCLTLSPFLTHSLALSHSLSHPLTLSHSLSHPPTHSHSLSHPLTHSHSLSHPLTHSHSLSHTFSVTLSHAEMILDLILQLCSSLPLFAAIVFKWSQKKVLKFNFCNKAFIVQKGRQANYSNSTFKT